jgi:membrane protease YdiL (CAAX protease family)
MWTLLVQYGYRVFNGSAFADQLTASLAKEYANPSPAQILLGGVTAACGEEIFFRGFLQQWLGLIVASLFFMVAHFGRKDIRVVSYWSIFRFCTSAFSLPTQRT